MFSISAAGDAVVAYSDSATDSMRRISCPTPPLSSARCAGAVTAPGW
jgi:hypothetical protein